MRSGPNYDQFYARREPWSTIIVSRARLCEFLLPSSQLQHLTASFATRMVSRLMAATLANRAFSSPMLSNCVASTLFSESFDVSRILETWKFTFNS